MELTEGQRAGKRTIEAIAEALRIALRKKTIRSDGEFYSSFGMAKPRIRNRSAVRSSGLRKAEMIPPSEICEAILQVVVGACGATKDEVVTTVSRALGFSVTTTQLRDIVDSNVDILVKDGGLESRNAKLYVSES